MQGVSFRLSFAVFLLGSVRVAHGLSLHLARDADLAVSAFSALDGPPAEKDVLDALANINASLRTLEDAIQSANSTAYSMADNTLQAIVDFEKLLGTLATTQDSGHKPSLTENEANQTVNLIDTVRSSVEQAKANVSTNINALSNDLSVRLPAIYAIAKQVTTQFLDALTMVEDIYNVSQSQESFSTRKAAKRAARKAVRDLRAQSSDANDDEEASSQQVGVLRRLVNRFGFEAARQIVHRAIDKLHGSKPEEDAIGKETKTVTQNALIAIASDSPNASSEEMEATSMLEGHVLANLGVDSHDDLEAALLRKGPSDIGRQDACAQATQKIYHANRTLHKLSRKFIALKTTVHKMSALSVGADVEAIESINNTVYSSLEELSPILNSSVHSSLEGLSHILVKSVTKGLRKLAKVRFHMGEFLEEKTLIYDAVSTLSKTAPLAATLRSTVEDACLSGACGEAAQKACEASTL